MIGALLGLALTASAAQAHGAIAPAEAPAGQATSFTLTIPHGCAPGEPPPGPGEEVAPTIEVALRLPIGATLEDAQAPEGWNADPSSAEGRDIIAWSSGRLAPDEVGRFTFTATVYGEEGEQVPFEVFQGCTQGAYRWVEIPGEGGDAGTPDQPAPLVRLTSSAAPPAGGATSGGADLLEGAPGEGGSDVDGADGADAAAGSGPSTQASQDEATPAPTDGSGGTADDAAPDQAAGDSGDGAAAGGAAAGGTAGGEPDGAATDGPPVMVLALGGLVIVGAVAAGALRLWGRAGSGGGA